MDGVQAPGPSTVWDPLRPGSTPLRLAVMRAGDNHRSFPAMSAPPTPPPIDIEAVAGPEWAEWYRLTPAERWVESAKLWPAYLDLGGSLAPEPDTQSPFFDAGAPGSVPADGRPGLRLVGRSGV